MQDDSVHMTCMEIWGGNQTADNAVTMSGLDAWIYSKPYGQADGGGDVYYVSSCATGRITRLLLADVSGHGKMVADIATVLRRLMQKYVNFIDQSSFVTSMNHQFTELSAAGCFATAIVSTFFAPTNELTLCIAGHPSPLIYRAATKRWSYLAEVNDESSTNIPLGIDQITDWMQFGVELNLGDLVLCYTDSLIESHGNDGEMLGLAGLLEIANQIELNDPGVFTRTLLDAIASRAEGNLSMDDVTVLLFRPNGARSASFMQRAFAPIRMLAGVACSILPGSRPAPWPEMSLANIGGAVFAPMSRYWSKRNAIHKAKVSRP
ncbi:MAG TPA: PP2C family protein-serine/threonine phosphatase [Tepidisphaeraceae bacterium]|nr:PP2C family protein-serine/threonine phosphatase [Tepidisphaeraceae bacterium]